MGKVLWCGDPHVKPENIPEWLRLTDFIIQKASDHGVKKIVFSGDMFHTHMVIRMDVQKFWMNAIKKITEALPWDGSVILLKGNHDIAGDREREETMSALDIFEGYAKVRVVKTWDTDFEFGYIGYVSDEERFLEYCDKIKEKHPQCDIVFCHQTFNNATYDNGFFVPDGFDAQKVPFSQIVSGHIHMHQEIGKVFYGGTPKWDTATDANQKKGIWIFEEGEDSIFIPTDSVCTPIVRYVLKEGQAFPEIQENATVYLDLEGSSDWIVETTKKLKGKYRITPRPTDSVLNKEKKQTILNFSEFLASQGLDEGTSKQLLEYIGHL